MEPVRYRHTQKGYLIIAVMTVAVLVLAAVSVQTGWSAANIAGMAVLLAAGIIFGWLTVEIRGRSMVVRFGPGLVRKRVDLAEVRGAKVVRDPWYYGWGVHITPKGWLYNVSGLDAVEIELAGGKVFRVGTDEPQKLIQAILEWEKQV